MRRRVLLFAGLLLCVGLGLLAGWVWWPQPDFGPAKFTLLRAGMTGAGVERGFGRPAGDYASGLLTARLSAEAFGEAWTMEQQESTARMF